ncbi:MAG TPA: Ig-like domain-containing protein [Candidatus Binatia bacterium]|jgi:hypothetical protein|nr:Ig-like domain-containing protein [Candidatus Binatia bacterium]
MRLLLLLAVLLGVGLPSVGAVTAPTVPTTVGITGGSSAATQTLPPGQSAFGLRVPLRTNTENELVAAASNSKSPTATQGGIKIMQIALQDIVLARVEARRLTVQEIKTLVADGTIQLSDPENFNVSLFIIVLTIADQPVEIRMPVVQAKNDPEPPIGKPISIGCGQPGEPLKATETAISIPCGDGGGGNPPDGPPQIMIPFVIDAPDAPFVPPIPGVIVIEGRIKTLKEFFNVSLILSNVSSIFTLSDVQASLEVPGGKMSLVKPSSGPVMIDDLPPGAEKRGDFITRGDKIGTHTVTAHFSGTISGLGIATPIPVSGQASTDIEVKGPPKMDVRVEHPSAVHGGEPYELTVEITNTDGELPALYTSFALDVGADARIVDPLTGQPRTTADVRQLGDILPGEKSVQKYTILPLKTGAITSCTAGASENLRLDVAFVGAGGPQCAIGTFPSEVADLGGEPTVIVVPTHNTVGVTVHPAVTAIFSAQMLADTITSGFAGATFRLLDPNGISVPSSLEIAALGSGRTIAILRPVSNLAFGTRYTVEVVPDIFDTDGRRLASGYAGRFTTETSPTEVDIEAPTALLTIEPPTVPTAVPLGQHVPLRVDAFDNLGVTRIDLQVNGQFVDSQPGQSTTHFMLDTSSLPANQPHVVRVVAFDARGNQGIDQATITVFSDTTPPTVSFAAATTALRGRTLPVRLNAQDNGSVAHGAVFVDGETTPAFTGVLTPFQFGLATSGLPVGSHTLRGVVRDGAGNEAEAQHTFDVTEDTAPPLITFLSPAAGAQLGVGALAAVNATVTDDVGVDAVSFFLDAEATPRSTGQQGFILDSRTVALGTHTVRVDALDLAGNPASATLTFEILPIVPDTTAPTMPSLVSVGVPVAGVAIVSGQNGAVESEARVEVVNLRDGSTALVDATFDGGFGTPIDAEGGDTLRITALDKAGNRSTPLDLVVPAPPVLQSITVAPSPVALTRTQPSAQLVVTGHFDDATSAPITDGVGFVSAHPTIAAVNATGLVLPGQNGATTITVSAPGVAPVDVPVTVGFPTIASVEVTPTSVAIFTAGAQQTRQLTVTAVLSDGFHLPFPGVVLFASENETVATVTGSGLVGGVSAGSTNVVVAPNGFAPIVVPVTVTGRAVASIAIAPSAMTFIGAGQTQALTVTATFNDASALDVTAQASCGSNTPAVATVAGTLVTSGSNGDAIVTCTIPGVGPATATVRVKSYASIAVTPNPVELIGAGKTQALTVTATFSDASQATLPSGVTFATNNASVASVNGTTGLVVSTGVGTATITATFGTLQGTSSVHVAPRVMDGLTVSPASLLFTGAGQTADLTVTAHFNDGTTGPTTDPVGYQTSTPAVATVSSGGTVTAVTTGTATITVNSGPFTATVATNVDVPVANPPPVIGRIDRPRAAEGDIFVIDGANFAALPADNTVVVGGIPAIVLQARKDQLVVQVPIGVASGIGIATVDVQVAANAQPSNIVTLDVYQRKAVATEVTAAIDQTVAPGTILPLPAVAPFEARVGDRIILSSAPDILAPLDVTGTLEVQIDGGTFTTVTTDDITSLVSAGTHTVAFRIVESGGRIVTGPIHLIVGPDATGPIAGEHSVVSLGQSRLIPVTFIGLTDLAGTPLPDGSKVVVSTAGSCTHRDRANNCLFFDGGSIAGGAIAPDFGDVPYSRVFTVTGGRIDVLYDPADTEVGTSFGKLGLVAVIPADAAGSRTSTLALDYETIVLATIDTAAAPRTQSVVLANGDVNLVTVTVDDIRDSTGALVPDGAKVLVSTATSCTHRDRAGNCLFPIGGNIVGGVPSPTFGNVPYARVFTVTNGQITFQFDSSPITIAAEGQATAIVQLLPARSTGLRIGDRAFELIPITLRSAAASQTNVGVQPASVLADAGDHRTTITVGNITDGNGVPVPNGTKVLVSTLSDCTHRDLAGSCITSAGGVIVGGTPSATFGDVPHSRILQVQNGQLQIVYSSEGIALATRQTSTAVVQLLPATPAGGRIGDRAFVTANVTVAGYDQAGIAANPTSVAATGLSQIVSIGVSGILDAAGAPVPDGAKVVVSTQGNCTFRDRDDHCINSAGGRIANGTASADFGDVPHSRILTVQNAAVTIQYDPADVVVAVGTTATATVSVTPARPNGTRIGDRAFTNTTVLLTSPTADTMHVSTAPASVLADGGNNEVTVSVTNITDTQGIPVPDGTKVHVSTLSSCTFRDPAGNCVTSAGGTIVGGAISGTFGDQPSARVFTIQNGQVQVVYRPNPVAIGSPFTDIARVTFVPATPTNTLIGSRAFAVAEVMLTSPASADVAGPGSLLAGTTGTYVVTDLRDTSNAPIPDGTLVIASTLGNCTFRDIAGNCIFAPEGTITNGVPSATYGDVGHTRRFTVTGGQVSIALQAPAGGTVVLQILPSNTQGQILGNRSFALKSIAVTP